MATTMPMGSAGLRVYRGPVSQIDMGEGVWESPGEGREVLEYAAEWEGHRAESIDRVSNKWLPGGDDRVDDDETGFRPGPYLATRPSM